MQASQAKLILIAAGGTGGHLTPAQALSEDLKSRGYRVEIVTDKRGLKYREMFSDLPMHMIPSGTLSAGLKGKIRGMAQLSIGIAKAFRLLRRLKPDLVVGFGGYPSFPAMYAAQSMGIKTIIHEQNAIIGKANAMLVDKATRIAISTPTIQGLDEDEDVRAVPTGNPVRADIAALYMKPYPAPQEDGELRILVLGGSLGAKVFSDIVPTALASLSEDKRKRLHIVQQCRQEDVSRVKSAYDEASIKADLATFFDDVAARLEWCHLIITRSGASTVAEVTAAGRPAIFVPYPHHKDMQQKRNADAVSDVGGAWVMTENGFTPDVLATRIEGFLHNPSALFQAAEKARAYAKPDAARKLGNLVTAIVSDWDGRS